MQTNPRDSTLTLTSLGVLAFILADTTHEALGHGLATLATGGTPVLLTSSYLSTSGHSAAGFPREAASQRRPRPARLSLRTPGPQDHAVVAMFPHFARRL